jgi:oligopeptidase B
VRRFSVLVAALVPTLAAAQRPQGALTAPVTPKHPHVTTIHGRTRTDDYFWLRKKGDSEVVHHLEAENAYTQAVMTPTEGLQKTIYDEMLKRIKQTDTTASHREGDYHYYSRTEEGKQYPVFVRRRVSGGVPEVLFDQNEMAKGHTFYALGAFEVSDDGNLLAFAVDTTGYRQYVLRVKDLRTGRILADVVPRVTSVSWATDNKTLFVTTEDSITKRSDKFWRHRIGDARSTLLHDEKDELFDVYGARSRDKAMIIMTAVSKTSTEGRYIRADQPESPLTMIVPRQANHEYYADFDAGQFYLRTNRGAKNFRVVSAPLANPTAGWKDVVPHQPNVKVDDLSFFRDFIVVSERENGLPYLRVIDKKTHVSHRIATPEPVYAMFMGANHEYATDSLQYVYNSLVTPQSTISYDMRDRGQTVLKRQAVPGYDASRYESKRLWVKARDGVEVPVALLYRKGTKFDGSAPMLLYAYGSYGFSIDLTFSSGRVSLVDRGFVYAQAAIRGGGELGEPWREAGRMMKKMNTFNDFIDVAEYLEKNKYTSPDRMVIEGGSAGGMLMGAVTNMRPDLFKAVVAQVPFVDVVNTMLDASLPLTTSEYIEWGNPNEKPAYDYMMQYSPYDNVKAQAYPEMLIEISYNDSQVPYWEGAKFAAKIRASKTNPSTVLVKVNMGAGHGGSSGRYDRLKEVAFEYAYMVNELSPKPLTP